jgi:16S rRNA (guanine527-N7)-methyltransferase
MNQQFEPIALPSLGAIVAALAPYKVTLNRSQLELIREYLELLLAWNRAIGLTAIDDVGEIVARHFGESIFGAKCFKIMSGRLADVGTGAGFPGLALKIAVPELDVVLFESNRKKAAFLREVVQRLNLQTVEVRAERYELMRQPVVPFDFVCSRALGDYKRLLTWAREVIRPQGRALLWVGVEDSVRIGRLKGWMWDPPVLIPDSQRRVIISGIVEPSLR